jgi:hypothetical protein
MTFISSATVKRFLRYCIAQYDTKIKKKYVLGQVRLIFTVRGIQNLGSSGELMFQYIKMLEQTNDAFGSISFNRFRKQ